MERRKTKRALQPKYWLPALSLFFAASIVADDSAMTEEESELLEVETLMNRPYYDPEGPPDPDDQAEGEDDSTARVWEHRMPLMAQEVIDRGYDLPLPYGLRGLYMSIEQDLDLKNLSVRLNDGDLIEVPWVTFETGQAKHNTVQGAADMWLLPFMNVFVSVGHVDGTSSIPLSFPGDEALKLLLPSIGEKCDRPANFPTRPEACDQVYTILAEPGFKGDSVAVGTNIAAGWKQFFVTANLTYAHAGISLVNESIDTVTGSVRAGLLVPTKRGMLSPYIGAMYLDVEVDLTGRLEIPLSDDPDVGRNLAIDFQITQRNSDAVNYVAGFMWDIGDHWNLLFEGGFGGSRSHLVGGVEFRW